jgi:undecaprenyl phosphate N,N'-diacetylbacillosamine 1-phosphate transferase
MVDSRMRNKNLFIKRLIDLLGSLFGIIILSPLMFIIALSIKLTSKGPVFFKQERLGKNGKIFEILKFRTMVVNAEKIGDGLFVKTEQDNRITKVGRVLRATSLDELPQLINVIIGDMSLVGPRPPVLKHPYKYNEYTDFQKKRFEMKPGMTGLAQVTVRNAVPWDQRISIDVKYVENFNVWLDIKILLKTIKKVFNRESIYTHSENKNSISNQSR